MASRFVATLNDREATRRRFHLWHILQAILAELEFTDVVSVECYDGKRRFFSANDDKNAQCPEPQLSLAVALMRKTCD